MMSRVHRLTLVEVVFVFFSLGTTARKAVEFVLDRTALVAGKFVDKVHVDDNVD